MRNLFFFVAILIACNLIGQEEIDTVSIQELKLDLLKSPTNATFIIMNTSPTEIAEPGTAPEFFTSVQNSSNNFSALPNNYGFAITPFWWSKQAKELNFDDDFKTSNEATFYRTLNLSAGIVQGIGDDENQWRYALGIQSTIFRGKVLADAKDEYINKFNAYHDAYGKDFNEYLNDNPEYNLIDKEYLSTLSKIEIVDSLIKEGLLSEQEAQTKREELQKRIRELFITRKAKREELGTLYKKSKDVIKSSTSLDEGLNEMNQRYGFKWDFGTALALNSQSNKIDSIGVYRTGIWSNMSYTPKSKKGISSFTGLLLLRYLYYSEIYYQTQDNVEFIEGLSTFDIGWKIQYQAKAKFTLGIEFIYRTAISNSVFENTYKLNSILQYQVGTNKLVYASFGNDFNDNSNYGPEDLIVTFGFNIGIGENIKLSDFKVK